MCIRDRVGAVYKNAGIVEKGMKINKEKSSSIARGVQLVTASITMEQALFIVVPELFFNFGIGIVITWKGSENDNDPTNK